jgi:hypothetical protein
MPASSSLLRSGENVSEPLDAERACQVLRDAAELIREDPIRNGSVLEFGKAGQLVMTGDLHGNLKNFEKLQRYCDLSRNPARSVLLHELIHQELLAPGDLDLSIDLLLRAAEWKCEFPDNVFFLQSNHELAQLLGQEITKGGRSVLSDFDRGVAERFPDNAEDVLACVNEYISALPLAARTRTGVFMCHSLPDATALQDFDFSVFGRRPTKADLAPGGSAYALVWGRFQNEQEVEWFAEQLRITCFVVGHTPQEFGHSRLGRLLILASDHNHGTFLPIDLSREYTPEQLEESIKKFAAVE